MPLATIEETIAAIGRGDLVILVDDEDRENEGDLVIAAEKVTAASINFMAKFGRGLICLSMTEERLEQLQIPMMVSQNSAQFGTAFTVSVEAREGVTTGISAADRARTIQVAIDDASTPEDLVRPGHIFPLRARDGGVLVRTGQTEGSVDLARLAGLKPAAVICEILNDDGTMARLPQLEVFAREHNLLIASVADLIHYRLRKDPLVERIAEIPFPCEAHEGFKLRAYRAVDGGEHLALVLGDPATATGPVHVRVQHPALVGDVFRGLRARTGWQLHGALERIAEAGVGVLVYLHKPEVSRFESLAKFVVEPEDTDTLRRLTPRPAPNDAVNRPKPALRDLGLGAQILRDCGVSRMTVLTNSEKKLVGLDAYGLEVDGFESIPMPRYMRG
jgi:3,4-dihydroxy 2-butanone 4-phosphate synthase/GTP cyclohydrolase II